MTEHLKFSEFLEYDHLTGIITRKKSTRGNKTISVREFGNTNLKTGYKTACIFGKLYFVHRVAWFLFYGEWPSHMIDHINGDVSDNRISNLREADWRLNGQNKNCIRRGKLLGTTKNPNGKWRAQININKTPTYLGVFNTEKEAHDAYLKALAETNRKVEINRHQKEVVSEKGN